MTMPSSGPGSYGMHSPGLTSRDRQGPCPRLPGSASGPGPLFTNRKHPQSLSGMSMGSQAVLPCPWPDTERAATCCWASGELCRVPAWQRAPGSVVGSQQPASVSQVRAGAESTTSRRVPSGQCGSGPGPPGCPRASRPGSQPEPEPTLFRCLRSLPEACTPHSQPCPQRFAGSPVPTLRWT